MIGSSCVRVHQHGANAQKGGSADLCMGRSRCCLITEVPALLAAYGRPIRLKLTGDRA